MLPYSCIDSLLYTDEIKVYHSTQSQDMYGRIVRLWTFDRTERGLFKSIQKRMYMVAEQNVWNDVLEGHSEEDLLIDSSGNLHAPSEVLVTFTSPRRIEYEGPRKGLPTTYELRGSLPVIGAFGEVMHFDVQLVRSTDQEVQLDV